MRLFRYHVDPDYSEGFDAAHINALAAEVDLVKNRPIFRQWVKGEERWVDVFHPELPVPVEWLVWTQGFYRDSRPGCWSKRGG